MMLKTLNGSRKCFHTVVIIVAAQSTYTCNLLGFVKYEITKVKKTWIRHKKDRFHNQVKCSATRSLLTLCCLHWRIKWCRRHRKTNFPQLSLSVFQNHYGISFSKHLRHKYHDFGRKQFANKPDMKNKGVTMTGSSSITICPRSGLQDGQELIFF